MIDISRTNNDMYYRYKMPRAVIKHEGKAGNTRTIITNLEEVASSLKRSPLYILKFVSYELATRMDVGAGKYAVNGKYDSSRIQGLIYDFIDVFVMCPFCSNPETFYINQGGLAMECLACGKRSEMRASKLSGAILKDVERNTVVRDESYLNQGGLEGNGHEDDLKELLCSCEDKSEEAVRLLRSRGLSDDKIATRLLMADSEALGKWKGLFGLIPAKTLLGSIEEIVESGKEKKRIQEYLKMLEEEKAFKRSELFKYFTRPQGARKRSPEFKKEVNEYFSGQ